MHRMMAPALEFDVDHAGGAPVGPLPGRWEYTGPLAETKAVIDTVAFDYHVDIHPEALHIQTATLLNYLLWSGLEPLDEDECEPEMLDNGWVRHYLTPVVPVDDSPLVPA